MKTVYFEINIEVHNEDYSEEAMNKLLSEFEDLVYRNSYEIYDSNWFEDEI